MHFCFAFAINLIFNVIYVISIRNSFLDYENECTQLSEKSLVVILGQAFNPRYMSIDPPVSSRKEGGGVFGYKRDSYELPFYVDTDIISVGDFPAWETNHLSYFEEKQQKRRRRNTHNVFERMTSGNAKSDMFKSRPWECSSKINWIDLGSHYFPRYIRSVECTTKKCWYGHFDCKPKSFGVKVLRRKPGSCIRVSDKLIVVTSEHYDKPYAELWTWEEIAIDFCCECVMIY